MLVHEIRYVPGSLHAFLIRPVVEVEPWDKTILYVHTYLQYGAWATSKKLPCMHKAYYTPQSAYQIHVARCKLYADHRRIGRTNTHRRNIMTGGLLETRAAMAERAVTLPRTVRFAPGTTTLCSRRKGSDRIRWYTIL